MNKKSLIFLVIILVATFSIWTAYFRNKNSTSVDEPAQVQPEKISVSEPTNLSVAARNIPEQKADFLSPLSQANERVTKKPFGIFVTPQNSPVQPEKFRGYHSGTDFEIFPGEENMDIPVKAVCSGKLLIKKYATGYGGVAVESCSLNGEPITVVYGHLKLSSINYSASDKINIGDTLGILGQGYSSETSGERKHLHLGFHKVKSINILGYVQNKSELSGWMDPCQYVCD